MFCDNFLVMSCWARAPNSARGTLSTSFYVFTASRAWLKICYYQVLAYNARSKNNKNFLCTETAKNAAFTSNMHVYISRARRLCVGYNNNAFRSLYLSKTFLVPLVITGWCCWSPRDNICKHAIATELHFLSFVPILFPIVLFCNHAICDHTTAGY